MDAIQQSIDDLKTLMEKMNTTVFTLAPLVPSVASLVALPASVVKEKIEMERTTAKLSLISLGV